MGAAAAKGAERARGLRRGDGEASRLPPGGREAFEGAASGRASGSRGQGTTTWSRMSLLMGIVDVGSQRRENL
jgi:hypothetical protein